LDLQSEVIPIISQQVISANFSPCFFPLALDQMSLRTNSMQQTQTHYWAGSAALSRMGFPVPTCGQGTRVAPLIFIPWPELSQQGKRVYRIQSAEHGLNGMDHWMNATDIAVPSIIYRDFSSFNNTLAFAFEMVPGLAAQPGPTAVPGLQVQPGVPAQTNTFALRTVQDDRWVVPDPTCQRLITQEQLDANCWFTLFSM
jgi:hypothetical protein